MKASTPLTTQYSLSDTVVILLSHQQPLDKKTIQDVALGKTRVGLAPETASLLDERRHQVVAHVERQQEPAYGFNRGFGHNVHTAVNPNPDLLKELQLNLIRSHAMCVGEPCPSRIVRATMLLRAHSLAQGYSGVRSLVVTKLLDVLNADIVPIVPKHGSVSASGDLAPLSHIALGLLGEGEVFHRGIRKPAQRALDEANIAPLALEMKEGLALNNGVQFITAIGLDTAAQFEDLLRIATVITSLSVQVMLGSASPFDRDLHRLRPHRGNQRIASWLRDLLLNSPIQEVHHDKALDGEVQDPYNLRCAAQILGACYDLIDEANRTFLVEANSVTDNPLILPDEEGAFARIVSGGHFHGMPIAVKLYNLVQAASIMARLSNMRCARYVDEARNKGLGADLVWPLQSAEDRSISSAMMMAEYTSAALTNWMWGQAMPSHLFSISTDAGQEDHVSMGAPLALRLLDMIPRLADVLAIELAFATQAAAIRKVQTEFPSKAPFPPEIEPLRKTFAHTVESQLNAHSSRPLEIEVSVHRRYRWTEAERRLSPVGEAVLAFAMNEFPPIVKDRVFSTDIEKLSSKIIDGSLLQIVNRHQPLEWESA